MGSKDIGRKFETSFFTPPLGIGIMLEIFHSTWTLPELKRLLTRSLPGDLVFVF
jgi:hypothetical protein